jgi:hypothetical protein
MKKIVLALLILFLAYAATGWFLAPRFADKALRAFASGQLGLELQFENLLLYPFSFSTHLENLVILDREGRPLFTASAVEAQADPVSFWTQSPQFKSLVLEQPALHVDKSGTRRLQLMELLTRLAASLQPADETVTIDGLDLRGTRIVSEGDGGANLEPAALSFNFQMEGLGRSRKGPFQLTFDPATGSPVQFDGEMTWKQTGPEGEIRFSAPKADRSAISGSTGPTYEWTDLSFEAPFALSIADQKIVFAVRKGVLLAKTMRLALQPLAEIALDDVSAGFNFELDFGEQGLLLREASAQSGALRFTGLKADSADWVEVPVAGAEIALEKHHFEPGQPLPFNLRLSTEPTGEIRIAGQYGPDSETGAMVIDLEAVPMTSLIRQDSGILPEAMADKRVTARGRLQLSNSFASVALSGGFASGAALSFSGTTQYTNPLEDSRFEFELTGLDATRVSPWAEVFAGRQFVSGAIGASLALRASEGRLAGRYGLAADDLRLQVSNQAGRLESDPDFIFALLQDSDRHIGFTVSLDEQINGAGTGLAGWLTQETERYLSGLDEQPFETLARMVGTQADQLESVSFQAGQAGLTSRAVAQLEWLKTALQWRPGLALMVSGGYDPEADRYELAGQQIRLHVNLATAVSAAQRENSSPIDFADPGAQSVLEEFAVSRLGNRRVEEISRSFLMAEDSADATLVDNELTGFYQALFDALVENEQITERALLSLARFRARTVIDQLARHGVDRDRLDSGELEAVRASVGQGVPTRFELLLSKPLPEPQVEQPSRESEGFSPQM